LLAVIRIISASAGNLIRNTHRHALLLIIEPTSSATKLDRSMAWKDWSPGRLAIGSQRNIAKDVVDRIPQLMLSMIEYHFHER
jgi:hypothetical protein